MNTTKWEYMKLWDPSEERMNEVGAKGWELVALCKPPRVVLGGGSSYHWGYGGGGGGGSGEIETTIHDDIYGYFKRQLQ